ncbi:hypothetical protein [Mycobacterium sp. 29Ha]|uniref:RNA polymerase sigma factor n=1 Tax=Mycobacterium sp. 29Ha TaxID=2939268 RepID=UPI0029392668|nr:hypothetical protein [Mycobacterium sp. 29Ha]MDV3136381.1 hypothetical protein [Mycobacterium sp. 29Ha]
MTEEVRPVEQDSQSGLGASSRVRFDDLQPECVDGDEHELSDDLSADVAGIAGLDDCEVSDAEILQNAPADSRGQVESLAERLARHAADHDLFTQVLADNFSGRKWRQLGDDLLKYGLAVVDGWLRTGYIFAKTAQAGRPVFPTAHELSELKVDRDLREGLADVVVAVAMIRFQQQAREGTGWTYGGGASLSTYFVGGCVLAFNNEFQRWRRHERRWSMHRSTPPNDLTDYRDSWTAAEIERVAALFADPARSAADRDYVSRVLGELKNVDQEILKLTAHGYAQDEIGEILDLSERAIEGRLYRMRHRGIRDRVEDGDDER